MSNIGNIIWPGDPNEEAWKQKEQDDLDSFRNWTRLSRIVLTDFFHESGLYQELSRGQQSKLNRLNQLAINPELPLTRKEVRRQKHANDDGLPIWSLPLLPVIIASAKSLDLVEKYSKTSKPGSGIVAEKIKKYENYLNLSEAIENEYLDVRSCALMPEIRLGEAALNLSSEPSEYLVSMNELLEAAEEAASIDGTNAKFENKGRNNIFTELSPTLHTRKDQRARAAEVFMNSRLLNNRELYIIKRERRAEFLPDGNERFRIHTSLPYENLFQGRDLTQDYQPRINIYADKLLNPDPIYELLSDSRA